MPTKRNIDRELRILLEKSPLGIVLTDNEGHFLYTNPSFQNMLGYSEEEMLLKKVIDITHPDSIDNSLNAIKKIYSGEENNIAIEKQYVHQNGSIIDANTRVAAVMDEHGNPLYLCTNVENITEQKHAARQLNYLAGHDYLTNLINRREFERRTDQLINNCKNTNDTHALMFMDLDQFKVVNDTLGHLAGDEFLRQLGAVLQKIVCKSDTLARLGGDEFGLLVEHSSAIESYNLASKILESVQDFQFYMDKQLFKLSISIGIVTIDESSPNLSTVLRDADAACYFAKDKGRNCIHVHDNNDSEMNHHHQQMEWVVRINEALNEDRFCLYAQPITSINGGSDNHFEVLIRMIDKQGKTIPPGDFLPAAERYNIINKLDSWVIKKTFEFLRHNPEVLKKIHFISINISGQSLTDPKFLEYVMDKFQNSTIPTRKICFEITETAAILNLNTANEFIQTLRKYGCHFALDDFGSGLSSFGYLKKLPVDYLKIDGMFVKDIVDDPIDFAMVKSINEIGQIMGMKTIAEFVETDQIIEMLKGIGVDYAQGYGIAKPFPLKELNHPENLLIS